MPARIGIQAIGQRLLSCGLAFGERVRVSPDIRRGVPNDAVGVHRRSCKPDHAENADGHYLPLTIHRYRNGPGIAWKAVGGKIEIAARGVRIHVGGDEPIPDCVSVTDTPDNADGARRRPG